MNASDAYERLQQEIQRFTTAAKWAMDLIDKLPADQQEKHKQRVNINMEKFAAKLDAARAMIANDIKEIEGVVAELAPIVPAVTEVATRDVESPPTESALTEEAPPSPGKIVAWGLLIILLLIGVMTYPFLRDNLPNTSNEVVEVPTTEILTPVVPEVVASIEVVEVLYTVKPGDTLWSIAGEQLGDPLNWGSLWIQNQDQIDNPDLIFPGQVLTISTVEVGVQ